MRSRLRVTGPEHVGASLKKETPFCARRDLLHPPHQSRAIDPNAAESRTGVAIWGCWDAAWWSLNLRAREFEEKRAAGKARTASLPAGYEPSWVDEYCARPWPANQRGEPTPPRSVAGVVDELKSEEQRLFQKHQDQCEQLCAAAKAAKDAESPGSSRLKELEEAHKLAESAAKAARRRAQDEEDRRGNLRHDIELFDLLRYGMLPMLQLVPLTDEEVECVNSRNPKGGKTVDCLPVHVVDGDKPPAPATQPAAAADGSGGGDDAGVAAPGGGASAAAKQEGVCGQHDDLRRVASVYRFAQQLGGQGGTVLAQLILLARVRKIRVAAPHGQW